MGIECVAGRAIEVGEAFESLNREKGDAKIEIQVSIGYKYSRQGWA